MSSCPHDILSLVNCPYELIEAQIDDDIIVKKFEEEREKGLKEGYSPILVINSQDLYDTVLTNLNENGDHSFATIEKMRAYYLNHDLYDGNLVLKDRYDKAVEEFDEDDMIDGNFEDLYLSDDGDEIEGQTQAFSYWNEKTGKTYPLILFKIPVTDPYRIISYLPFGHWNNCPSNLDLMSICRYLYEEFKAIPYCISENSLEFKFLEQIKSEDSLQLAKDLFATSSDCLFSANDDITLNTLAKSLEDSTYWQLVWD